MADLVLSVLQWLWTVLLPLQLPMAVMGGIAVSLWKHVRATQDVDLLVGIGLEDEPSLIASLQDAGFRPKRQPPVLPLGDFRLLQLLYEIPGSHLDIQVDLLLVTSEYHRQALGRRLPTLLADPQMEVAVLACEDLILHKLIAGRLLDRVDVGALLRANQQSLDRAYLVQWAVRLGVIEDLSAIWREALPGERMPDVSG